MFPKAVADISAAISQISKDVGGPYSKYDPIGVSQLAASAYRLANYAQQLSNQAPGTAIVPADIPQPPWARSAADQLAQPRFQARADVTYLDNEGNQVTSVMTFSIPGAPPATAGSLQAQVELRATDALAFGAGVRYPSAAQFVGASVFTLMQV